MKTVPGDPAALRARAAQFRAIASWAGGRSEAYEDVASRASAGTQENQWVVRISQAMRESASQMQDLQVAFNGAANVLDELAEDIADFQNQARRIIDPLSSPSSVSFLNPSLTGSHIPQDARTRAMMRINALMPASMPGRWTRSDSGAETSPGEAIGALAGFLLLDDVEAVWNTPGAVAGEAGSGDWLGALGALGGGALAAASLIPLGKVIKVGKGASLLARGAGVRQTGTVRALGATSILKYASFQQVSNVGGRAVWIPRILGPDGRGGRAETVIYQHLLETRPGLAHTNWSHAKIDLYNSSTNTISSIKSIDPRVATFKDDPQAFARQIDKYIEDIGGWNSPYYQRTGERPERLISPTRELIIGVPSEGLSARHAEALSEQLQKSRSDVNIVIMEIP